MANGNQKQNNGTEQVVEQQQVETPVQAEPQQAQVVVQVTEQKKGIGSWLKAHWKGVTAAVTGTGAAVASAIVAYRKGKAAGMTCVPQQEQDDYSLNPNE